ncbi:MAG: BPTI/Kunitz-type proteinase inhibitor domain-containing protein [Thiohalocapsa sp.]
MYQYRFSAIMAVTFLMSACSGSPDEVRSSDSLPVSCLEQPDTGVCRAAKPAYYYDYQSDSCKRFVWGGCGGSIPFESMDACVAACGGRPAP